MTDIDNAKLKRIIVIFDCPMCKRESKSKVMINQIHRQGVTCFCEHCDWAVRLEA